MPPLLSEQAAFARHLFIHGYPLWNPDPVSLPHHLQSIGLRFGDLGTVDERGHFHVFHNILDSPESDDAMLSGIPQVDESSIRSLSSTDDLLPREIVSSPETDWDVADIEIETVLDTTRRTTQYSTTLEEDGAHIVLPQGAQLFELAHHHRQLLERCAREHGTAWLERYKDQLGPPRCSSLYLLTGFYKSCSWCIASFSMDTAANIKPVYVHCTTLEVDERLVLDQSAWRPTGRFRRKLGPAPDRQGRQNQSVFIRGITITPNVSEQQSGQSSGWFDIISGPSRFLDRMMGGPSEAAATDTPPGGVTISHIPNVSQPVHPSEIINRYLLAKVPSAKIAVTHDSEWMEMIKSFNGRSWTLEEMERRLEESIPGLNSIDTDSDSIYLKDKEFNSGSAGGAKGGTDLASSDLKSVRVQSHKASSAFGSLSSFNGHTRVEVIATLASCGTDTDKARQALVRWIRHKQDKGRTVEHILTKLQDIESKFIEDTSLHSAFQDARAETFLPRSRDFPPPFLRQE